MPDSASRVALRGRKRRTLLGVLAVVGVGALVLWLVAFLALHLLAEGIGEGLDAAFDPKGKGVVVTTCRPSSFGGIEIRGTAHNSTPSRSSFFIHVVVSDGTASRVANVEAVAHHVEPGQTAPWKASTRTRFTAGATCNLTTVLRGPL